MERKCLECGEPLVGRSDKKFCCDMCRNAWHNKTYRNNNAFMTQINNKLAQNRRILEKYYETGETKVSKVLLEEERFDFFYFTSFERNSSGKITYHCYEYSYSPVNSYNFIILRD